MPKSIVPDWDDVANLMDKKEMRLSRLSDTNDYFSEPILKPMVLQTCLVKKL